MVYECCCKLKIYGENFSLHTDQRVSIALATMNSVSPHIIPVCCTCPVPNVSSLCPVLLVRALPFLPFLTMLTQLKSSMVLHGCPLIFLTINPGERHSSLALHYAGESIDIRNFHPQAFSSSERLKIMLKNPLAVLDYFHNVLNTIIDKCFKGGMFGELAHHYGTIEYQGRFTPHMHMAVKLHIPCAN